MLHNPEKCANTDLGFVREGRFLGVLGGFYADAAADHRLLKYRKYLRRKCCDEELFQFTKSSCKDKKTKTSWEITYEALCEAKFYFALLLGVKIQVVRHI